MKKVFDVTLAMVIGAILWPWVICIGLCVRATSPPGRGGKGQGNRCGCVHGECSGRRGYFSGGGLELEGHRADHVHRLDWIKDASAVAELLLFCLLRLQRVPVLKRLVAMASPREK